MSNCLTLGFETSECTSVLTVSSIESIYKKHYASRITFGGKVYQGKEFIINMSLGPAHRAGIHGDCLVP